MCCDIQGNVAYGTIF